MVKIMGTKTHPKRKTKFKNKKEKFTAHPEKTGATQRTLLNEDPIDGVTIQSLKHSDHNMSTISNSSAISSI